VVSNSSSDKNRVKDMVAVKLILQGKQTSHLPNAASAAEYQCFRYPIFVLLDKVSVPLWPPFVGLVTARTEDQGAEGGREVASAAATAHATFGNSPTRR